MEIKDGIKIKISDDDGYIVPRWPDDSYTSEAMNREIFTGINDGSHLDIRHEADYGDMEIYTVAYKFSPIGDAGWILRCEKCGLRIHLPEMPRSLQHLQMMLKEIDNLKTLQARVEKLESIVEDLRHEIDESIHGIVD